MPEVLTVFTITVLAVISPGADFAMVLRASSAQGRASGIITALGISLGVLIHTTYAIAGVGPLLARSALLFTAVKVMGACYLVYLGIKTFRNRPHGQHEGARDDRATRRLALRTGFFTNALNPKTMLFIISVYVQLVNHHTPLWQQASYALFIALAHLIWFATVAFFLSSPKLRAPMLRAQGIVNRLIGVVLACLGITLILARPMSG
jgi:RhtB (resistance to homoserine/threonine) family protein